MPKDTQIEKVKKIFEHVSIDTFVKYFYVFQKNKETRDNSIILEAFKANDEPWEKKSSATRASKGKSIFVKGLEITALNYITEYANKNKISEDTILKAIEIKAKLYIHNYSDNIELDNEELIYEISEIESSNNLTESEKKVLIKYRIGQSSYRLKLIEYWNGCSVSGSKIFEILISSHIKPYRECGNLEEKFDLYNGFLLTPNYDRLFDKHLISFNKNGQILISQTLNIDELNKIGINKNDSIKTEKLTAKHISFLNHHNALFDEKEKLREQQNI